MRPRRTTRILFERDKDRASRCRCESRRPTRSGGGRDARAISSAFVFRCRYGVSGCRFVGLMNRLPHAIAPMRSRSALPPRSTEEFRAARGADGYLARRSRVGRSSAFARFNESPRRPPWTRSVKALLILRSCDRIDVRSMGMSIRLAAERNETTLSGESLGSCVDEERSQLR